MLAQFMVEDLGHALRVILAQGLMLQVNMMLCRCSRRGSFDPRFDPRLGPLRCASDGLGGGSVRLVAGRPRRRGGFS